MTEREKERRERRKGERRGERRERGEKEERERGGPWDIQARGTSNRSRAWAASLSVGFLYNEQLRH